MEDLDEKISLSSILQFRQSLGFLDSQFMFSIAFGDVSNRDRMIKSSQEVYRRLCLRGDSNVLKFDVLALIAATNGSFDRDKLKDSLASPRPGWYVFMGLGVFV